MSAEPERANVELSEIGGPPASATLLPREHLTAGGDGHRRHAGNNKGHSHHTVGLEAFAEEDGADADADRHR